MLTLLLMLLAAPLPQTAPLAEPPTAPTVRIDADGTMRAVEQSREAARQQCHNGEYQRADNGTVVVRRTTRGRPSTPVTRGTATIVPGDLMFRQGDPVEMTLLLERRIGECSVPISYDLMTGPGGALPSFPAGDDR